MVNSSTLCQETSRQVNQCSGCDYCLRPIKENNATETMAMIGLYAAEANTYYLYSQSWFHTEDQNKKK
jgi:hypothetical protein